MKKIFDVKTLPPYIYILLILLEVLLIVFLPWRWISALLIILINGYLGLFWYRKIAFQELKNRSKIEQATILAEENLTFVSEKMPAGIISFNVKGQSIEWLNPFALAIKDKIDVADNEFLKLFLTEQSKNRKQITLSGKTYTFQVEQDKGIIYFLDITQNQQLKRYQINMQPMVGIISIDNYDDAIDKLDDKQISYINSFVTTMLSDWTSEYHTFFKRLNSERYIFFGRVSDMRWMMEKKFDILDKMRMESENNNVPLTLSIGVAYGIDGLDIIGEEAQNNLDIALVRGGDQVVLREVKDEAKPIFFGGKSAGKAKRTRVRSRAMSTALTTIFSETGDVYIMGHRLPDMDAIGAAFGVARMAKFHQKNAYVVIDEEAIIPDVERCLAEIKKYPELMEQVISPKEAIKQKGANDLLVMVDYHKPSLSISQELYEQFDKIVIIDHHRRGEEFPSKPLLTYIESTASSASELVAELIQYQSNKTNRLSRIEATLLLSGMVVDTKSFTVQTTARTFDVASYLRTCGADTSLVQYLLSSDLETYLEISHLIAKSEYVTNDIVVTTGDDNHVYNSVTAAKAADTILAMANIKAAFVLTKRTDGSVGISARSAGTINVQLIMEQLGGGGHYTNAATQLSDASIQETKEQLISIIHKKLDDMYEKE